MVLVSHRKQFIFLKTLKTASTSVEAYFERYCMPEGTWTPAHERGVHESEAGVIGVRGQRGEEEWYNHMPAEEVKAKVGDEVWNSYYKFTTVRDPFDKAVSAYFHLRPGPANPNGGDKRSPSGMADDFLAWLRSGAFGPDRYIYTIGGDVAVDEFIRYESLTDGIANTCARIDVPFDPEELPRYKTGVRDNSVALGDMYNDESIAIIADLFAPEMELFGYMPPARRRSGLLNRLRSRRG